MEHQSDTSSGTTILRHLVLDGATERTGDTITMGEYSENETLETVRIVQSSNIRSIGEAAFRGCPSLRPVDMEGGVTSIGAHAFYWLLIITIHSHTR